MVTTASAWKGEDSLPEVRRLMALGVPLSKIARQFGVSRPTLYAYLSKKEPDAPTGSGSTTSPEGDSTANDKRVDSTSLTPTEEVEQ